MEIVEIVRDAVSTVTYNGKKYTCKGERTWIDGKLWWMYTNRTGLPYDILVCADRYDDKSEFFKVTRYPGITESAVYGEWSKQPHGYVDLGLPSGTLWATCNIGADSPEKVGQYFAWGETQGYYIDQIRVDKDFSWDDYRFSRKETDPVSGVPLMNKYNFSDGLTELESEDDAATVNLGGDWCMPTDVQFQELIDNTSGTFDNSINSWVFTANNGNRLIVPASSKIENGSIPLAPIQEGYCWTKTLSLEEHSAWCFKFEAGSIGGSKPVSIVYSDHRYVGITVRPVKK